MGRRRQEALVRAVAAEAVTFELRVQIAQLQQSAAHMQSALQNELREALTRAVVAEHINNTHEAHVQRLLRYQNFLLQQIRQLRQQPDANAYAGERGAASRARAEQPQPANSAPYSVAQSTEVETDEDNHLKSMQQTREQEILFTREQGIRFAHFQAQEEDEAFACAWQQQDDSEWKHPAELPAKRVSTKSARYAWNARQMRSSFHATIARAWAAPRTNACETSVHSVAKPSRPFWSWSFEDTGIKST